MKKNVIAKIVGYISIVAIIVSIVLLFVIGGANLGYGINIAIITIISIIGVIFATISGVMSSENIVLMNIGLGGNAIIMIGIWMLILMNK